LRIDREDLPVEFVHEQVDQDLPADAAGARRGPDHRDRARLEDGIERMHENSYSRGGVLRTSSTSCFTSLLSSSRTRRNVESDRPTGSFTSQSMVRPRNVRGTISLAWRGAIDTTMSISATATSRRLLERAREMSILSSRMISMASSLTTPVGCVPAL